MSMLMTDLMMRMAQLEAEERKYCTLLGIGPMSTLVIEASMELASEKRFPVLFIASRNQIDCHHFGGGYVKGWDQKDFVQEIRRVSETIGFNGLSYVCRDHGGPWQRDEERLSKLNVDEAMERAKQSFHADVEAGFDLLHIDPTKDPHVKGILPLPLVIERTMDLIDSIETYRQFHQLPPVAYEIGTEETNGGLTSKDAYQLFIQTIANQLAYRNLPMPCFIVGQTGTLTRMTENVGHFDAGTSVVLSREARRFGVGLKEHNCDYIADSILYLHPHLGITASNVAPEFGVAETEAYILLSDMESELYSIHGDFELSHIREALQEASVQTERWRKWMPDQIRTMSNEEAKARPDVLDLIVRSSGHYTFDLPQVNQSLTRLFDNISAKGLDGHRIVLDRIKRSIQRYIECFNLVGLTDEIIQVSEKHATRKEDAVPVA